MDYRSGYWRRRWNVLSAAHCLGHSSIVGSKFLFELSSDRGDERSHSGRDLPVAGVDDGQTLIAAAVLRQHGSLVGSSGAILSYTMCKAMNRSFFNVILGGFGGETSAAGGGSKEQRPVKSGSADDAAYMLSNAESVIIVPGYGLAVARAQHAINELAQKHMNVLLAEAEVPYEQVFEMEDINGEFAQADVAIVPGANDVVNPVALQKGSPIYGMPILDAYKARTVIVNKRSMAAGPAEPLS
jgi:NAD(P) transhydrogenase subunit beta